MDFGELNVPPLDALNSLRAGWMHSFFDRLGYRIPDDLREKYFGANPWPVHGDWAGWRGFDKFLAEVDEFIADLKNVKLVKKTPSGPVLSKHEWTINPDFPF